MTSWNLFHLSLGWPPEISSTYLCGDLLKSFPLFSVVTSWNLFRLSLWWPPEISSTYFCSDLLKSLPLISVVTSWNLFHFSLWWPPEISSAYLCGDLLKPLLLMSVVTSWNLMYLSLTFLPPLLSARSQYTDKKEKKILLMCIRKFRRIGYDKNFSLQFFMRRSFKLIIVYASVHFVSGNNVQEKQFPKPELANLCHDYEQYPHRFLDGKAPKFSVNQCSWSVTFWYGSGSADLFLWLTDPIRRRILLFSSVTFKTPTTTKFSPFFAYYFSRVDLPHSLKIKSHKKSQNSRNKGFPYYFCLMMEGSGSVLPTNGDPALDPGGPKNYRSSGSGFRSLQESKKNLSLDLCADLTGVEILLWIGRPKNLRILRIRIRLRIQSTAVRKICPRICVQI